jgi:hypothetical protein
MKEPRDPFYLGGARCAQCGTPWTEGRTDSEGIVTCPRCGGQVWPLEVTP